MSNELIYPITNPEYKFDSTEFQAIEGYLIIGEKENKAVISQFGNNLMSPEKAIEFYKKKNLSVLRIYIEGKILSLMELKEDLNKSPIKEVLRKLEKELLAQ